MKEYKDTQQEEGVDISNYYLFRKKQFVYNTAASMVHGNVIQVGLDNSIAESTIAQNVDSLTIIDKYNKGRSDGSLSNVEYHFLKFPSLEGLNYGRFDIVLSFQSIEHTKDDFLFVQEIARVLKPGGKFIVTTPNKKMSITRNPCHYREYTIDEFKNLLGSYFQTVEACGVYGKENVMKYYECNKKSVRAFSRFDIFDFEHILPRIIFKPIYKILNKINRRKLLVENRTLTTNLSVDDYYLDKAQDNCFDLFFIATK